MSRKQIGMMVLVGAALLILGCDKHSGTTAENRPPSPSQVPQRPLIPPPGFNPQQPLNDRNFGEGQLTDLDTDDGVDRRPVPVDTNPLPPERRRHRPDVVVEEPPAPQPVPLPRPRPTPIQPKPGPNTGPLPAPGPNPNPGPNPAPGPVPQPPDERQCIEPARPTPDWIPGLPNKPAESPLFTDDPGKSGVRYTDGRTDGLLAFAMTRANALDKKMEPYNRLFAKQIRDVKVFADTKKSKVVRVQVEYMGRMKKSLIELQGQMEDAVNVPLTQIPPKGSSAIEFSGLLTCADVDHGCQNIVMRLDRLNSQGKIIRTAFLVHRWGAGYITMSESDRRDFARLPNKNQTAFAELLSNTLNNRCLATLADIKSGRFGLPQCSIQLLQSQCGNEEIKKPAAKSVGLRTWAVAYGRAAFELVLSNGDYDGVTDFDLKRKDLFAVRGPLVYSDQRPMGRNALAMSGATVGLRGVTLMTNDGGGNINLQIDFLGDPKAAMRLSVTAANADTRYNQGLLEKTQAMQQAAPDKFDNTLPLSDLQ